MGREEIQLVFAASQAVEEDEDVSEEEDESDSRTEEKQRKHRVSPYVGIFEDIVNIVNCYEDHLLTEAEWNAFLQFSKLEYNSRYVLVRLLLRKPQWHRVSSLKYLGEVGEVGLKSALKDICRSLVPTSQREASDKGQQEHSDVIDLTSEDEGITVKEEEDQKPQVHSITQDDHTSTFLLESFCFSESIMTLEEVLHALSAEEIKDLMKQAKITTMQGYKPNKSGNISSLLLYARQQKALAVHSNPKRGNKDGLKQTTLCFPSGSLATQEKRLKTMALRKLGQTIKVNPEWMKIVQRLELIYYRHTSKPPSFFLPSLLTRFKKRAYPSFTHSRTNIWSTMKEYLQYEEAILLEAELEAVMEERAKPQVRTITQSPGPSQLNPRASTTPLRTRTRKDQVIVADAPEASLIQRSRVMKKMLEERIYPRWQEYVKDRASEEHGTGRQNRPGLVRFEPGYVYTRMVEHCMAAYGPLKEYSNEAQVLRNLIEQKYWRKGKTGLWYDRLALLQMNYLCKDTKAAAREKNGKDPVVLMEARELIKAGLEDDDTRLVHRTTLFRRLERLEKQLKIPDEERSWCVRKLKRTKEVSVIADRVWHRESSLKLDEQLKMPEKGKENLRLFFKPGDNDFQPAIQRDERALKRVLGAASGTSKWKWVGKSVWKGRNDDEVNVETRALEHYEDLGFKGFHSETQILTTLFALLFWDIMFSDIPGAFETKFQTAPLDLGEESFYTARKEMIGERLEDVKAGKAKDILLKHDKMWRQFEPWCTGVRWDMCSQEDLAEIVECLGGESLSIVCQLFCEDYAGRASGVPDLIVWNYEKRICKFVEVKGPGDRPSETQKLWFDTLLRAGTNVDLCKVYDRKDPPKKKSGKRKKKGKDGEEDEKLKDAEDVASASEIEDKPKDPEAEWRPTSEPPRAMSTEIGDSTSRTSGQKDIDASLSPDAISSANEKGKAREVEEVPDSEAEMEAYFDDLDPFQRFSQESTNCTDAGSSSRKRKGNYWPAENRVEVMIVSPSKKRKTSRNS